MRAGFGLAQRWLGTLTPIPCSGVTSAERFVPAAGFASLTGAYDAIMALTMREGAWRPELSAHVVAGLDPSGVVVDVGAGTGSQAAAIASRAPAASIIAIDGDERMLRRGRQKVGAANVRFIRGFADQLPLSDASADRVVLSLVLHHLDPQPKRAALDEAVRVLRRGGRVHVADWGRPSVATAPGFRLLQAIDGATNTREHAVGRLPHILLERRLKDVRSHGRVRTAWGTLDLLAAVKA